MKTKTSKYEVLKQCKCGKYFTFDIRVGFPKHKCKKG